MRRITSPTSRGHRGCRRSQRLAFSNLNRRDEHYRRRHWDNADDANEEEVDSDEEDKEDSNEEDEDEDSNDDGNNVDVNYDADGNYLHDYDLDDNCRNYYDDHFLSISDFYEDSNDEESNNEDSNEDSNDEDSNDEDSGVMFFFIISCRSTLTNSLSIQ